MISREADIKVGTPWWLCMYYCRMGFQLFLDKFHSISHDF